MKIEPAKHAPAPKVVNLLEALKASIDAEKKKPAAASVRDRAANSWMRRAKQRRFGAWYG
jgi:non-homologous end joining protein Ku